MMIIKWEGLNWMRELMENVLSTLYFTTIMSWLPPRIACLSEYITSRWKFVIKHTCSKKDVCCYSKKYNLPHKLEQISKSKLTSQCYYLFNITIKQAERNSYTNKTNRRQTSWQQTYLYTQGDLLSKPIFKRVPQSLFCSASPLASISFPTY